MANPLFPHVSSIDQLFDYGEFAAYEALGKEVCVTALKLYHKHKLSKASSEVKEKDLTDEEFHIHHTISKATNTVTELVTTENKTDVSPDAKLIQQ